MALSDDFVYTEAKGKEGEGATEQDEMENNFALTGARIGLISTIMTSYSEHCNVVISPD